MVTLLVGNKKTPFHVHMDMLCSVSPFFKSAFMGIGSFKEKSERLMTLPEDRTSTIDRMIHWLYSKHIPYDQESMVPDEPDYKGDNDEGYRQLTSLYITADKYGILALKNDIINTLQNLRLRNAFLPPAKMIRYVYRHTLAGSGLRRLIVDWHVWHTDPNWVKNATSQKNLRRCPDFAAELVTGMLAAKHCGRQGPWRKTGFGFHEIAGDNAQDNNVDSESDISDISWGASDSDESNNEDESSSSV